MTRGRRLVVFDVDGTLVDSQAHIVSAAHQAFIAVGRPVPPRADILAIVGLSLPEAIARLAPEFAGSLQAEIVAQYKLAFNGQARDSIAPLYPGARETLDLLKSDADTLLGVATGNSRRGMARVLAHHGLQDVFATVQVADDHPSKPHPSMLRAALDETGTRASGAVMIGDTTYDIQMGRAADMHTIGVAWGYHGADILRTSGASDIVGSYEELRDLLALLWVSA